VGYDRASEISKEAFLTGKNYSVRFALEKAILPETVLDKIFGDIKSGE